MHNSTQQYSSAMTEAHLPDVTKANPPFLPDMFVKTIIYYSNFKRWRSANKTCDYITTESFINGRRMLFLVKFHCISMAAWVFCGSLLKCSSKMAFLRAFINGIRRAFIITEVQSRIQWDHDFILNFVTNSIIKMTVKHNKRTQKTQFFEQLIFATPCVGWLTFPSADSRIESDLMSLCTIPLEWRNARAWRQHLHTVAICCSFILTHTRAHAKLFHQHYIFIII